MGTVDFGVVLRGRSFPVSKLVPQTTADAWAPRAASGRTTARSARFGRPTAKLFLMLSVSAVTPLSVLGAQETAQPDVASAADVDEQVARIHELAPEQAVTLADSLWQQHPNNVTVGRALLSSLNAADETIRALKLADELSQLPGLPRVDQAQILRERLVAMRASKELDALDDFAEKALALTAAVSPATAATDEKRQDLAKGEVSANALRPRLAASVLSDVAISYNAAVNYFTAGEFYQRAIALRPGAVDAAQRLYFSNLGAMLAKQGRFPEAIDALQSGLRIGEELNEEIPPDLFKNLGGLHLTLGKFEESLPYTLRALDGTEENSPEASSLYSNLGVTYQQLNRFDEAEVNYRKALTISDSLEMDNVSALNNLAFLLHEKERHQESLELLERVREITEKNQQWDVLAIAKKNQAENWVALGDRQRAAGLMEEARQHYVEHDLRPNRLELYPVMIENLEALGNYQRAFELMREYKELYDETVSVESAEKVAELQAQFELERKTAQVQEMQDSQDIEGSIRDALIAGLALLSIIAFLLLRALHFRGRANQRLAEKNDKIERQANALSRLNDRLTEQTRNDELTGLFNRRFLNLHLEKELPRLERVAESGGRVEQLVIMADLDHFKQINDRYGHAVGDQVLKAFAKALTSCARESDFCVRWGGEEFLWLCRDASLADGPVLCDRLLKAAADAGVDVDGQLLAPVCSIGFAPYPLMQSSTLEGQPTDGQNLAWSMTLEAADTALYEAKRKGRNRWCGLRPAAGVRSVLPTASLDGLIQCGDLEFSSAEPEVKRKLAPQ